MALHLNVVATPVEQLRSMGIALDYTTAVKIFVVSLDYAEVAPVTAPIEALFDALHS